MAEKNMDDESSNSKHISLNVDSKFIPKTISDILKDVSLVYKCSKSPWEFDSQLQSYENELAKMAIDYEKDQQYISPLICDEEEQLGCLSKGKGGAFVAFNKDDVMAGVDDEEAISDSLVYAEKKKQRRCWSPELHRAFIHAVDEIGGAKVATPRRILEKMKVEGLTSDEMKSHLQKYRTHIRRLASASSTGPTNSQCLINMEVSDNDDNNNM